MNTIVTIKVTGDEEIASKITQTLRQFEQQYSAYLPDSDVSRINAQAGAAYVPVAEETYALLKQAVAYGEESGGRFDITVGPLVDLWDVTADDPKVPGPEAIARALALVDDHDVLFRDEDKSVMLRRKGQKIDLGGLAKGAAMDRVAALLKEENPKSALVSLGGNLVTYGGGEATVGIQDPRGKRGDIVGKIEGGETRVVSTSGDYERYFEADGKRYHHVLNPKTGTPADSDWMSVMVLCDSGTKGDYLSTTLFMHSREELQSLLGREDFAFIAVGKDHTVLLSKSLEGRFQITNGEYKIVSG